MNKEQPIILCVDDDVDDQQMVLESIRRLKPGYKVVAVYNGLEALQYLDKAEQLPALIILDINMPLLDGKQTLIRLKNDTRLRTIPVVMFTTSSSILDKTFCAQWKVPFITKPIQQEILNRDMVEILGLVQ